MQMTVLNVNVMLPWQFWEGFFFFFENQVKCHHFLPQSVIRTVERHIVERWL